MSLEDKSSEQLAMSAKLGRTVSVVGKHTGGGIPDDFNPHDMTTNTQVVAESAMGTVNQAVKVSAGDAEMLRFAGVVAAKLVPSIPNAAELDLMRQRGAVAMSLITLFQRFGCFEWDPRTVQNAIAESVKAHPVTSQVEAPVLLQLRAAYVLDRLVMEERTPVKVASATSVKPTTGVVQSVAAVAANRTVSPLSAFRLREPQAVSDQVMPSEHNREATPSVAVVFEIEHFGINNACYHHVEVLGEYIVLAYLSNYTGHRYFPE